MRVQCVLTSREPMLMHSQRGSNPKDPLVREMKQIQAKRKKTDEDLDRMSDIEFQLGMYHDAEIGPFVPALNLKRCIQDGAKFSKRGKDISRGLWTLDSKFKLLYDGPRDMETLLQRDDFRDCRMAGVNNGLILRTRPIFHKWGLIGTFLLDDTVVSLADFRHYVEQAGSYVGLSDYRPEFGRFEAEVKALNADSIIEQIGTANGVGA